MVDTERLRIRKFQLKDTDDYLAIFGNPVICRYDDFEPMPASEALPNMRRIKRSYRLDEPEQEFAVELRGEARVVGSVCFLAKGKSLYIGYHFNESYHGRGLAIEAVRGFVGWLRRHRRKPIRALTDPANVRSAHLLRKLGFRFERRKRFRDEHGQPKEELVFHLPESG